jgi:hypothetical protein
MGRRAIAFSAVALVVSSAALTAQVRVTKPNGFTLELGGKCFIYSLGYQRDINPTFALDAGISYLGGGSGQGSAGLFVLTGGARLYMLKKPASPYISGGIGWISAGTGDVGPADTSGSTMMGYISPGFEFRSESGFVFRGGVYLILIQDVFFVWPGLTFGIAF